MATWRCPHCGTLQSESPRCFLCQRSATSCGTCARYRPSLVDGVGYCAVDRRREPLTGSEQRACWTGAVAATSDGFFGQAPVAQLDKGLIDVVSGPLRGPGPVSGR